MIRAEKLMFSITLKASLMSWPNVAKERDHVYTNGLFCRWCSRDLFGRWTPPGDDATPGEVHPDVAMALCSSQLQTSQSLALDETVP